MYSSNEGCYKIHLCKRTMNGSLPFIALHERLFSNLNFTADSTMLFLFNFLNLTLGKSLNSSHSNPNTNWKHSHKKWEKNVMLRYTIPLLSKVCYCKIKQKKSRKIIIHHNVFKNKVNIQTKVYLHPAFIFFPLEISP